MNETTPFFQSNGFYLCLGLIIGAIVGWFACAICAISGQASRDEERWEEDAIIKDHKKCLEAKREIKLAIDEEGKPDRE